MHYIETYEKKRRHRHTPETHDTQKRTTRQPAALPLRTRACLEYQHPSCFIRLSLYDCMHTMPGQGQAADAWHKCRRQMRHNIIHITQTQSANSVCVCFVVHVTLCILATTISSNNRQRLLLKKSTRVKCDPPYGRRHEPQIQHAYTFKYLHFYTDIMYYILVYIIHSEQKACTRVFPPSVGYIRM